MAKCMTDGEDDMAAPGLPVKKAKGGMIKSLGHAEMSPKATLGHAAMPSMPHLGHKPMKPKGA